MYKFQFRFLMSAGALTLIAACGGGGDAEPTSIPAPAPASASAFARVISCEEDDRTRLDNNPSNPSIFLSQPAMQIACLQTVVDSVYTSARLGETFVAGFAGILNPELTEISRYNIPPASSNGRAYEEAWIESESTGIPGELWWGRQGRSVSSTHIAIGQLAWRRQADQLEKSGDAVGFSRMAGGETSPFPTTREMLYEQVGATSPTYSDGSGGERGRPPILPGTVSMATLMLNPSKPISGVFTMNIEVDGHTLTRTLPLRANLGSGSDDQQVNDYIIARQLTNPDNVWSLKAAPAIGSSADCTDFLGRTSQVCYFPAESPTSGQRTYMAQVQFFGATAEFAAIRYSVRVDSPREKFTWNSGGEGIVILKRNL
jgi:hypothetical protein